jgi:hypothetical protein
MEEMLPIAGFEYEKLDDVLVRKAKSYLNKGYDIPDEVLDEMLGGKPNLYSMNDWKIYSERKMLLRKYLCNEAIHPSLNPKFIK